MKPAQRFITHLLLVVVAACYVGPFLWMISTSLHRAPQLSTAHHTLHTAPAQTAAAHAPAVAPAPPQRAPQPLSLLPRHWHFENYTHLISDPQFDMILYARNTLVIAVLAAVGTALSSSLAAYSLAKLRWRGQKLLFVVMLGSMMLPFQVTMVPMYREFAFLHLIGTNMPLWLPAFFGVPFFIFLLRQFYLTIPNELSEAARIDGCSDFGIWWRIIVPLSKPALAVCLLFSFMGAWNNFIGPLVYLTHQKTFTLAVALQSFQSRSGGINFELLMAASTMVILPIIVLFFLAQKTFIQGIATTGMKG